MKNKNFIIIIVICLLVFIIWVFNSDVIETDNNTGEINNTINKNSSPSVFSGRSIDNNQVLFTSDLYHFSFTTDSEFWYSTYANLGSELDSYLFSRTNSNTSEQPNRDTPNGFNTAADDRMIVVIYGNEPGLTLDDLDEFISWQETASPSSGISETPVVKRFTNVRAIEAITASGIGAFSHTFYFLSDDYIIEISSDDVSKDELYDIAESFNWTGSDKNNILDFQEGSDHNKLTFSEAGLQLDIPNNLLEFTKEEIERYNNPDIYNEYYLWRACRSIYKETNKNFSLWVSFDEQDDLCGTERFAALLAESEFQDYKDDFCSNLESADRFDFQQYYGCEELTNPPDGFIGYTYYEFIHDYGIQNSGTIIREVFLENLIEEEKKIIVGYMPNNESLLNIKPSEFTDYVKLIKKGEYEIFNSTNENMKLFEDIIRSLSII